MRPRHANSRRARTEVPDSACSRSGGVATSGPERSNWHRLVAKVFGLTAARVLGAAGNGIALILLARWLGPAEFGQFSVAWAVLWTASGVLALGLPTFALRASVMGRVDAVGYAIYLNLMTSILAGVVGFVAGQWISSLDGLTLALLAASVAVEKNAEMRVGLGTEFGRGRAVNLILAGRGVAILLAVIAGNSIGISPLRLYASARLAIVGVAAVLLVRTVRQWPLRVRRPKDGSLESLASLATAGSLVALRQVDATIVGSVAGPFEAGLFGAVQRVVQPVMMVTSSICLVAMGPAVRADPRRSRKAIAGLTVLAVASAVVLGIAANWSAPLVRLVLGNEFGQASAAFAWTLVAIPALAVSPVLYTILQGRGLARQVAWILGVTTVLYVAALPSSAAIAGATGAAVAHAAVMWMRLGWCAYASTKIRAEEARVPHDDRVKAQS